MPRNRLLHRFLRTLMMVGLIVSGGEVVLGADNIDPDDDGSQFAWGEYVGWVNAEPLGDGGPGVFVEDDGVSGYLWSENTGWVSLSCLNTATCGTSDYGVTNDGIGNLAGYAWGESVGWVSFSCTNTNSCGTASYGVVINPANGEFSGRAWGENIGWITFRSDGSGSYGITTSWRPTSVNQPPDVTLNGFDAADEGDTLTYNFNVDDPDAGDLFTIVTGFPDCGTGGNLVAGSLTTTATGGSFSCEFLDGPATPTVSIKVTDSAAADSNVASVEVTVSNVNPIITTITGPIDPIPIGGPATISVDYTDEGSQDTHDCTFSWDDGTTPTTTMVSGTGPGDGSCNGTFTYGVAGVYTVTVTVTDKDDGEVVDVFEFVVIYDPSGGFVTGGGFINSPPGAYQPDLSLTGKANFGFVSKYKKGASVPTGNTLFQFKVADLKFQSTAYDWLVVAGHKAQYKGTGTINGVGGYDFLLTAHDGQQPGGQGVDKFRIKIKQNGGGVIYDNKHGNSDDIDGADPQVIGGGSIVIHKK